MTASVCLGTNKSGEPCTLPPMYGFDYCYWHNPDPDIAEKRRRGQSMGGKARHGRVISIPKHISVIVEPNTPATLRCIDDIFVLLEAAATYTFALENSCKRNRVLVSIAMVALRALEVGDLEERIAALEATLSIAPPSRGETRWR